MSNRGRFGKYGEMKRLDRLRQAGTRVSLRLPLSTRSGRKVETFDDKGSSKTPFWVRHALDRDIGFIGELSGKVFAVYGPYREMVLRWFQSGLAVTLVALMEKRPVGFAMIGRFSDQDTYPTSAELLAIAVSPSRRRMGAARMLMDEVENTALSLGVVTLILHTARENLPAQKLFAACGFRPSVTKTCFYPAGQDALLMVKDLSGDPVKTH